MKLHITRTITWTTTVDMSSYPPGWSANEAAEHEKGLALEDAIELIDDDATLTTNVRIGG